MEKLTKLLLCLFLSIGIATAQTTKVTGVVISADDGEPVIGASVLVPGTTIGTVTNYDGTFVLDVPQSARTLVFSYIGMISQEVAVSSVINVTLQSDMQALDEVVVTALGISREKKALGYGVTEVSGEDLLSSRGGLTNPMNALQGKVAGLSISSSAGNMGGTSKILIRGNNSVSGNNSPLFVIDGVPIEGGDYNSTNAARGGGGYDYGNMIQDINPDDIESITVLKGPNASALYGSRAANGVIMITTKGSAGKEKAQGYGVAFNSSVGFEVVNKFPKLQRLYGGGVGDAFEKVTINGKEYLYPDYATDESWGPKLDGTQVLSWYDLAKWEAGGKVGDPTTSPWSAPKNDAEDFFETGVSFTNNVSITQNTDRSNLRISYTNTDLKGYHPGSKLNKNSLNVGGSIKSADKRLEMFANVTYFNSRAKGRPESGYGDNSVMQKFVQWGHRELDMKQLKDMYMFPDGSQVPWNRKAWNNPAPAYANNPYWSALVNRQNDSRNRVYGNAGFSFQILPELKFQYRAMLDFFVDKQYERNAVGSQELSRYMEISRQNYELNNEFMLMYNKNFNEFSFAANLGANLMHNRYEYVYGETQGGLVLPDFYNLKNSVNPARAYNLLRKKSINSVFGNVSLGWRNMLYVDASLRNDWSSTLPDGHNSYLYPSVTGSFIFSELVESTWLSFGKVRLGYAIVGNDTDPYRLLSTYSNYTSIDGGNNTPGYILELSLKNPDLKPEKTHSFETGIELSFFNNRVGLDFTYYSNKTKNQIIPLSVSGSTGYTSTVINAGQISNKGVELSLNASPVQTRDFQWETTLTLASNKNKVDELIENNDYYRLQNAPFKVEVGAIKGAAYGVIMGTDFEYIDGQKVIRSNGTYKSSNGNVNLGSIYPDFTGGWSNTFKYKNLDLGVLLDFSKGGHFFSTSYMWGMYSGMLEESAANNVREDGIILEGVKEDGTPNDKRIDATTWGAGFYSGPAAQSVLKSDYVKLREISLGYTIPLKRSDFVKYLRISAYGRNLAVWGPDTKHFDPEAIVMSSGNVQGIEGGALPGVASYGFSLNLKF